MVAPGTVTAAADTGTVMRAQIAIGGTGQILEGVPILQQYGVSSVPPSGSDVAVIFIAGDRSNGVVVATGYQGSRPVGKKPGETVVYGPNGSMAYFGVNGIAINGGGQPVTLTNAPAVTITATDIKLVGDTLCQGNLTVQGNLACTGSGTFAGAVSASNIP